MAVDFPASQVCDYQRVTLLPWSLLMISIHHLGSRIPTELLAVAARAVSTHQQVVMEQAVDVKVNGRVPSKTNPMQLFMHYMPWFQNKEFSKVWGYHWTMKTQDPEKFVSDERREVASHFYPLIGPYDSGDPDVFEYHLLLMLYAGVDGVLIDWYGSHGKVNDYSENLENSEALISKMSSMGMKFGIVYEEYVCEHVAAKST